MADERVGQSDRALALRRQIDDLTNEEKVLVGGRRFFTLLGAGISVVSPAGLFVDPMLFMGALIVGIGFIGVFTETITSSLGAVACCRGTAAQHRGAARG